MPKFLSDGIFDGSSTDLTVDGSFRSKGDLNYFGLDNIFNEAEIVINTGNSGSPQIGFTENGDVSWAIGVDDADNGFKIHGSVGATIPTINNLSKPFFEIDTIGQIFQRPPTGVGSYTKLGFEVSTQEVALELGDYRTGSGFAYIDLIGDTTYADYGLRLIRWNGGANTTSHLRHRGTGYLEIETEDGGDILINPNSGNVGIFETNPSQKLHVAGNARVTGAYYDSSNLPGTSGQILSSTATGTGWVDANTIASGSSETVEVPVKNLQGSALTKGDPVYISGDVGASGRLEVKLADAGQASKMPAVGLLKQDLGINGEGFVVVTGKLRNLVTSPIDGVTPAANAVIYVKSGGTTGAALTTVKPTGPTNLIQNMGKVGRVSTAADGTLVVSSILRSNDIPNLTTGKIWVGDGNTVESTVVHLDETNGRMGIGTANPQGILHISSDSTPTLIIGTKTANQANSGAISFREIESTSEVELRYNGADNAFKIWTSLAGDALTVLRSNGNVSIGTDTTSAKLEVRQDANNGNTGAFTNTHVKLTASATADNTGFVGITAATSTSDNYGYSFGAQRTSGGVGDFKINYHNNSAAGTNRFIIDQDGNVGINDTDPDAKLTVFRTDSTYAVNLPNTESRAGLSVKSSSSFDSKLTISSGADSRQYIQAVNNAATTGRDIVINPYGGNVGIGATSPNQRLTINGTDQYVATEQTNYVWGGTTTLGVRMGTDATAGLLDFRRWTGTGTTHGTALITQVNSDGGYGLDFRVNTQSTNTTATTSRMFLSTSGEVGIGTTGPVQKLDVAGSVRVQDRLYTNANATNSVGILGKATVNGWASRYDSNNANFSGFYFDGSHHSIIVGRNAAGTITNWIHATGSSYFNGGNVGIGTNNPQTGLHLSSGVDNRTVGGTDVGIIRLTNTYGSNFGAGGEIQFGLADVGGRDVLSLIKGSYTGYNSGNYGGDLEFHTRKPDGLGLQQRMTITDAGNVGVGETSPQAKLHVSSGTANEDCVVIIESDTDNNDETSNPRLELRQDGGAVIGRLGYRDNTNSLELINQYGEALYLGTSNSTDLTILSNGDVGVGETNPQKKLHVSSSDQSTARIRLSNTNTASGGDDIELVAGVHSLTQDGFSIYNATSAQTQLVIQGGGNVGIATPSPSKKLHVTGATQVDNGGLLLGGTSSVDGNNPQLRRANSSNDLRIATAGFDRMTILGTGNVGIGETNPAAKLDISDTADEVDLTSATNFAINTEGAINAKHYKHINLESPEFEWSIGGSTDLNWKKLATIVINDISYSGFGAEVEITDFSGNYGSALAEYGDVYRGGLSIYHQGGTGVAPKEGIITIHNDMIPHIRIYKIAGSGNSSYEIQVKSPTNYRQIYVKLKAGIGNQIADIFSHANNTNGSTSGGTAYTPDAYTSANQFKTGFTTVTANRGNILYRFGVVNPSPSYPLDVTGTIRATGDVIAYSDIRVKENIKTIDNAVNKVKALRGVEYNKIDSTEQSIGVIAQEIEEVIPQVVKEDDKGMKSVAYGNITAVLIEAIKEQQKQIDELKSQLNAFTK